MQQQGQGQNVQVETGDAAPMMTLCLIFAMVAIFTWMSQYRIEIWTPHTGAINWMRINSVQALNVMQFVHDQNWQRLATQLPTAALSSFAAWQLGLNCYLMWALGATIEQRLGAARYVVLVLLTIFVSYGVLVWDRFDKGDMHYFYGPTFILAALVGAGMVFPEIKQINTQWFKKSRGEIFSREPTKTASSKYKIKTKFFVMLFLAYTAGSWYYSRTFMSGSDGFQTFEAVPFVISLILGYLMAWFLVWSATGTLREGPVKLMCIRKYNDIKKLDVGHEVAVRGTSMALGLPEDRVREWTKEQQGKMNIK
jgi:Rhomboid family.